MLAGVLFVAASAYILALPFRSHLRETPAVLGSQTRVECGSALNHRFGDRNRVDASARAHACLSGFATRRYAGGALALVGLALVLVAARALPTVQQSNKTRPPPPAMKQA
jgi:hypothetical protein